MVRIHFLGTNGWYDTETGNTICILIDAGDYAIILDAGNGIYKLDTVTSLNKPFYLILSHLHLDHICGLHILAKFAFLQELRILVPPGQTEYLQRLLSAPYTIDYRCLPIKLTFGEFPEVQGELPFPVQVFHLDHSVPTLAVRLVLNGKVLSYCADTGYCANAFAAARGADLLIAECAYLPGEEHPDWPHLNPQSAAHLAREAQAQRLVLVHFDAARYPTFAHREEALSVAQAIFHNTQVARDGLSVTL